MRKKNGFIYPSDIFLPLFIIIILTLSFYMMQKRNQELRSTIDGLNQRIDYYERQNKTMGKLLENAGIYYKDFLD